MAGFLAYIIPRIYHDHISSLPPKGPLTTYFFKNSSYLSSGLFHKGQISYKITQFNLLNLWGFHGFFSGASLYLGEGRLEAIYDTSAWFSKRNKACLRNITQLCFHGNQICIVENCHNKGICIITGVIFRDKNLPCFSWPNYPIDIFFLYSNKYYQVSRRE